MKEGQTFKRDHTPSPRVPPRPGPTDEELLRLLHETEDAERRADAIDLALHDAEQLPQGDPCPACGEPAEHLGECHVCGEEGCLPPDLWTPGMPDNCLTLCARCARTIHLGCAREDFAGNPTCPTCRF